jgi:lipopolysaccharide biosynthesis regulator YciM
MNPMDMFDRHITAAQGYVELGMHVDANEELEHLDPEHRILPAVVALRVEIYRALKKWDLMQTVAKMMALHEPNEAQWTVAWAYATRRADCLDAARLILVNAVDRQPDVAIFHYNLACYDCQLGLLDEAKARLRRTFELEPRYRLKALDDEDLESLWGADPLL